MIKLPGAMIVEANNLYELQTVRGLFQEYAESLKLDLTFQNFESELQSLPGQYARPTGCILLALIDEIPAGCVALKPLIDGVCEMKRLYVRPFYRGTGLGRELALQIIEVARKKGYKRMVLDTIPATMAAAAELYESLGFVSCPAYYDNPIPGAKFMALDLQVTLG